MLKRKCQYCGRRLLPGSKGRPTCAPCSYRLKRAYEKACRDAARPIVECVRCGKEMKSGRLYCEPCRPWAHRERNSLWHRDHYAINRGTILKRETARIQRKRKNKKYQERERIAVRERMRILRANRKRIEARVSL